MNRLFRYTSVFFTAAFFAAVAAAQPPNAAPATAAPPSGSSERRLPQKPTNLKVLPVNTDIRGVMHQYEADLGVHCSFCHAAADKTTHHTDFASDSNPAKETARFMIQMTADLNDKYLDQMPNRNYGDPITCGTCHRGHHEPPVFVASPEAEGNHPSSQPGATSPQAAPSVPSTGSSR